MKKILLLLFFASYLNSMQLNPNIIYTERASEEMKDLKVKPEKVNDILMNGNKNRDKDNHGVILYSQRSALPHPEYESRNYDQLVVAVSKESEPGTLKILSVFYKKNAFLPQKSAKK